MAFRKKAKYILEHNPDIVVIPECESLDKLKFTADIPTPSDSLWFGTNPNKGLGIFSYSDFHFSLYKKYNPKIKYIIPLTVSNDISMFTLFAIWANNPDDEDGQYVEQVWKAIHYYKNIIKNQKTVLIGDFNSNSIWDKPRRIGNHTDVVQHLSRKGIESAYHLLHREKHGSEKHFTLFMYRHKNKPYHIDYCFTSADLSLRITSVEIGDYKYWTQFSDHVPLIVSMKDFL
jgi:exodeoxyribonuclease-3